MTVNIRRRLSVALAHLEATPTEPGRTGLAYWQIFHAIDELEDEDVVSRADTLPPVKQCGCGAAYDAESWMRLPFVGVMGDEVESCELRNCPCSSTISIELVRGFPEASRLP